MSERYQHRPGDRAWTPCGAFPWRPWPLRRVRGDLAVVERDGVVFVVNPSDGRLLAVTTADAVQAEAHARGLGPPDASRPLAGETAVGWGWEPLDPRALGVAVGDTPPGVAA